MVKFARSILLEMTKVTTELETLLGPGTADLTLRIGVSLIFNRIDAYYVNVTYTFLLLSDK